MTIYPYLMKRTENFLLIFLLMSFGILYGQYNEHTQPKDTITYYKNGQPRWVSGIDNLSSYNGKLSLYYDSICDYKNKAEKLFARRHMVIDPNGRYIRTYYRDSLVRIFQEQSFTYFKDEIRYHIYMNLNKMPLTVFIQATKKDTLATKFSISEPDTLKYRVHKMFDYKQFNIPTEFDNLELNRKDRFVRISFYDKVFMKEILYKWLKDEDGKVLGGTYLSFYRGNFPKEYGHYQPPHGRMGMWYTYYKNGLLKSEGEYSGSKFDDFGNEIHLRKTGKWIYYSKKGCVENVEIWNDGKLIETKN